MRHAASSSSELLKVIEQSGAAAVHRLTPVEAGRSTAIAASSLSRAHLTSDQSAICRLKGRRPHSTAHVPSVSAAPRTAPACPGSYRGGGFVIGDLKLMTYCADELANASGLAVVAVDYGSRQNIRFPPPSSLCGGDQVGTCQASAFVPTRTEWRSAATARRRSRGRYQRRGARRRWPADSLSLADLSGHRDAQHGGIAPQQPGLPAHSDSIDYFHDRYVADPRTTLTGERPRFFATI